MAREHLDRTPYSAEQLNWLARTYGCVKGAWCEVSGDGLELRSAEGRFSEVFTLTVDGFNWMNTNPVDLLDHRRLLDEASGDVLLTGFGLGLGLLLADLNPLVWSTTVIESDRRVMRHVWPMVARRLRKPARFILADADIYDYSRERYGFAFIDHAREAPPVETVERVRLCSDVVAVWWNEVREVTAGWQ